MNESYPFPQKLSSYIYAGLPEKNQKRYRISLYESNDEFMPGIVRQVFNYFDVDELHAYGSSHKDFIVKPRYIAMYFIRIRLKLPLKTIGKFFGNRDHSTVHYGVNLVKDLMSVDKHYRQEIEELERFI
jgi:chromosomal replication initiator protein